MIQPTKYMSVQNCSLRVAATILSHIRRLIAVPLVEIDDLVSRKLGDAARVNIQSAINLLFLCGVIRYDEMSDTLVYVSPAERPQL